MGSFPELGLGAGAPGNQEGGLGLGATLGLAVGWQGGLRGLWDTWSEAAGIPVLHGLGISSQSRLPTPPRPCAAFCLGQEFVAPCLWSRDHKGEGGSNFTGLARGRPVPPP